MWLLISQVAGLNVDATDGVLAEVQRSQGLNVKVRYTADEAVLELSRRHQSSLRNSAWKTRRHRINYFVNTWHNPGQLSLAVPPWVSVQ